MGSIQLIYVLPMALTSIASVVGIIINARSQSKIQTQNAEIQRLTAQLQQRAASGTIETSDARTVWEQGRGNYDALLRLFGVVQAENQRLQARIDAFERERERTRDHADAI